MHLHKEKNKDYRHRLEKFHKKNLTKSFCYMITLVKWVDTTATAQNAPHHFLKWDLSWVNGRRSPPLWHKVHRNHV
jgi:hypothetical protein